MAKVRDTMIRSTAGSGVGSTDKWAGKRYIPKKKKKVGRGLAKLAKQKGRRAGGPKGAVKKKTYPTYKGLG